jgi:uncharacterized protein YidB (DUF937 family)
MYYIEVTPKKLESQLAGSLLAGLLPAAIDHVTPDGEDPDTGTLESSLTTLLSGLRR